MFHVRPTNTTIGSKLGNSSRRKLTPDENTITYGRTDFQSHGCGDSKHCSAGCIAATTNAVRDLFNNLLSLEEGNNTLHVVAW